MENYTEFLRQYRGVLVALLVNYSMQFSSNEDGQRKYFFKRRDFFIELENDDVIHYSVQEEIINQYIEDVGAWLLSNQVPIIHGVEFNEVSNATRLQLIFSDSSQLSNEGTHRVQQMFLRIGLENILKFSQQYSEDEAYSHMPEKILYLAGKWVSTIYNDEILNILDLFKHYKFPEDKVPTALVNILKNHRRVNPTLSDEIREKVLEVSDFFARSTNDLEVLKPYYPIDYLPPC